MFDIGFSELLLFGVIALIVLGPEKLPQAARTAGQWYAKIRRTVSTLQSEIEAELDLAETRQQMQNEIAKIRQTEANMKREIAEMRGSMQEFEHSQNQNLNNSSQTAKHYEQEKDKQKQATPAAFAYAYHQDINANQDSSSNPDQDKNNQQEHQITDSIKSTDDTETLDESSAHTAVSPITTKPWENMWFRLGAYDKARRLPTPPFLPNYQADILLNANLNKTEHSPAPNTQPSLDKQGADE
ncbi:Sec-independent protein translocase protein TatB [Psychrobacter sp. CAL346-MNA-CIBAN-0220]|uniref:Sec-independent protein translocase protein TatB n=1 Tax=Psychrobacter sp. CAL346-MNA-CIBAN-0220 TaxID=3140457 RepID=UPI0033174E39